jgi:penicillin-binding protein 2
LPDEKQGLIPTPEWKEKKIGERWFAGDTYINAIGQGFVLVSPLQACRMMSAVANGGHLYRPVLIKQTRNRETGIVKTFSSERVEDIRLDAKALEELKRALSGVVVEDGGTAHAAQTPLATVAGKTGTAQVVAQRVPGRKLTEKTQDHSWFIAFAPADKPKIAVAVIVEHGGHGGGAAAIAARRVIEEYLKNDGPTLVQ